MTPARIAVAVCVVSLLSGGASLAEPTASEGAPLAPEERPKERALGQEVPGKALEVYAFGAAQATFETKNNNAHGGGGLAVALAVTPGLAVSGAAKIVTGDDGTTLPIDVLLRRPIGLTRSVHPWVGGGLATTVGLAGGARSHAVGLASALGVDVFVSDTVGVFAQAEADFLVTRRITPALGLACGLVLAL